MSRKCKDCVFAGLKLVDASLFKRTLSESHETIIKTEQYLGYYCGVNEGKHCGVSNSTPDWCPLNELEVEQIPEEEINIILQGMPIITTSNNIGEIHYARAKEKIKQQI